MQRPRLGSISFADNKRLEMATLASIAHRFQESPLSQTAADELLRIQREQLDHDEYYHREIARLDTTRRITHLTLHFSKYVGYLAEICDDGHSSHTIQHVLTDTFIIAVSAANTLNVRISDCLGAEVCERVPLAELGQHLQQLSGLSNGPIVQHLLISLSKSTGRMAKACEGLDHVESQNFRENLVDGLSETLKAVLVAAGALRIDLATTARARLAAVKSRFIFHGYP